MPIWLIAAMKIIALHAHPRLSSSVLQRAVEGLGGLQVVVRAAAPGARRKDA